MRGTFTRLLFVPALLLGAFGVLGGIAACGPMVERAPFPVRPDSVP